MPTPPTPWETGIMTGSAFEQAIEDFNTHVRHDTAGQTTEGQQPVDPEELAQLANAYTAGDRLVFIHLGLEGDAMRYGVSFAKGTPTEDGLEYPDQDAPTHLLENGSLLPISAEAWNSYHDAYRALILLDRGDGQGFNPLMASDARMVVLAWDDEVEEMYRQCVRGSNSTFRLVVSSICVEHDNSDGGPQGFRHAVAFHTEVEGNSGWEPLLDDTDHTGNPWQNKAADYGNLCPPRCKRMRR